MRIKHGKSRKEKEFVRRDLRKNFVSRKIMIFKIT